MADYTLRMIPGDPYRRIPVDSLREAAGCLKKIFTADSIEAVTYETPEFIDCGGNLERIECPLCGSVLDFDWWGEVMSSAAEGEFSDLSVKLPCCGETSSLNELKYDFPCGFACCEIKIMNPADVPGGEWTEHIRELFSGDIRVIHSHI